MKLIADEWEVRTVPLAVVQQMVREQHYSRGGSNTAVYRHGLFRKGDDRCLGVAWWIPPTKAAAVSTYPVNWQGVLALSRLVVDPSVPTNGASFLLSQSRKMIDSDTWPCLVTYADDWRGHTGAIYKADNWQYVGKTNPEAVWVRDGVMISRKAGPKTRTKAQMLELGAEMVGKFAKHKFVRITKPRKKGLRRPIRFDNDNIVLFWAIAV